MANKIEYEITVAPKSDYTTLRNIYYDELNAIAAVDSTTLDGGLFHTEKIDNKTQVRYAKVKKKTTKFTEYSSNTTDLLLTNVYDNNGIPLHFKSMIRREGYVDILVNGKSAELYDDIFIYTNDSSGIITYVYRDGRTIDIEDEFYPVYINNSNTQYSMITSLDNRTYSAVLSQDNKEYIIRVYGTNMSYKHVDTPLLTLTHESVNNKSYLRYRVSPYSFSKDIEMSNVFYELQYRNQISNYLIKRSRSELVTLNGTFIYTQNAGISDNNIIIQIRDKEGLVIHEVDCSKRLTAKDIFIEQGKIDISKLYSKDGFDPSFHHVTADYNYCIATDGIIDIPITELRDFDHVSIGVFPNTTKSGNGTVHNKDFIKYFVVSKSGDLLFQNYITIGNSLQRIVGYGFSEHGWSENGYSGIIESNVDDEFVYKHIYHANTGYSELGYSLGPYSGAAINGFNFKEELSLKNGKVSGYIELARVYRKDLSNLPVIFNLRPSIPKNESMNIREVGLISDSYVKFYSHENKELFTSEGVYELPCNLSLNTTPSMVYRDNAHTVVKFVYKDNSLRDGTLLCKDAEVLKYARFYASSGDVFESRDPVIHVGDNISELIFKPDSTGQYILDGRWLETRKVSEDGYVTLYVKFETSNKYKYIGVSLNGITPSRKLSL